MSRAGKHKKLRHRRKIKDQSERQSIQSGLEKSSDKQAACSDILPSRGQNVEASGQRKNGTDSLTGALKYGVQERVIDIQLGSELAAIPAKRKYIRSIDEAEEACEVLTVYLSGILRQSLKRLCLDKQTALVNDILEILRRRTGDCTLAEKKLNGSPELLLALLREQDWRLATGLTADTLPRPQSSLSRCCLFSAAKLEPSLAEELCQEIRSADRVDLMVSFILKSGLSQIRRALETFANNGGRLRVLTTTYMGATQLEAVEMLSRLPGAEVRICYDGSKTRLHAKVYLFHRDNGFSTAYVGSSNLSHSALTVGQEWNVKLSEQDQPAILERIRDNFAAAWECGEFTPYTEKDNQTLRKALNRAVRGPEKADFFANFEIRPKDFQQEILDRLKNERMRGRKRNLVVAATGTGKTVVSAFDYKNYRASHQSMPCRLLFVAHREEILRQSLATFRGVLRDQNFGAVRTGYEQPDDITHLFMTIQSFRTMQRPPRDYYQFIIVDEFHHAAARSYIELLDYFQPNILLGLTATPERLDGQNILDFFDGHIAAEIRLPDALNRGLLCPFSYYGVTDSVDLRRVSWRAGRYDDGELSRLYTEGDEARSRCKAVWEAVERYVPNPDKMKALAFCVSQEHARFMAESFNEAGIPSRHLTASTSREDRINAQKHLASGELRCLFTVDLYNEGVDIPEVDTVLFLRPTQSLTIFLQQLGRGLRKVEGKDALTALDFIGQANQRYDFESKYAALFLNTNHNVEAEIRKNFPSLPAGCTIVLEEIASTYILNNIRAACSSNSDLVARLRTFAEDTGKPLSLKALLTLCPINPKRLYRQGTFASLCEAAGLSTGFTDPLEKEVRRGLAQLASANSGRWLDFILECLPRLATILDEELSAAELAMLRMFYITFFQTPQGDWFNAMRTGFNRIANSRLLSEIGEFLEWQRDTNSQITEAPDLDFDCPLELHCSYTRDQIFAALGYERPGNIREGVKWLPEIKTDVLLVTLIKQENHFSDTTRYDDYAINANLFHWQSQNTTSAESVTGQRYIRHREQGSHVLLFVRENKDDPLSGLASSYTCLGTVKYESHEGSRPMSIVWRLDKPMPPRFLQMSQRLKA